MIAVSQCPSSTSFVPAKVTSYYSFTTEPMQESEYTKLPHAIHSNHGLNSKLSWDCQNLLSHERPIKPTLSVIPSTREKNSPPQFSEVSLQTPNQYQKYHHENDLGVKSQANLISICPAPLDLTCHKSNDLKIDYPGPEKITGDNSRLCNDNLLNGADNTEIYPEKTKLAEGSTMDHDLGSQLDDELIRRQKRREQNKAAAQSYRLRKKSVTELIETEHEIAFKRNKQLMAYKTSLEAEISRMRSLLQDIAMTSKLKEEEKLMALNKTSVEPMIRSDKEQYDMQSEALDYSQPSASAPCSTRSKRDQRLASIDIVFDGSSSSTFDSQSTCSACSAPVSPDIQQVAFIGPWTRPINMSSIPQISIKEEEKPAMRPRQNTWPMDTTTSHIHHLTGKSRKKEQNRLASRRFRVRRKMEMSDNEVQLAVLEKRNHKLRRICDDYTKKVEVIKEVLEKLGCSIPSKSSFS